MKRVKNTPSELRNSRQYILLDSDFFHICTYPDPTFFLIRILNPAFKGSDELEEDLVDLVDAGLLVHGAAGAGRTVQEVVLPR